ncbi:MAG TPA: efflux RND transporter periplasmic adaptor subunit [Nannocystaceae bacterium]|nr:efflux RND transporter periplasmic adaptor subunit [Nannocystaceae bacterium]
MKWIAIVLFAGVACGGASTSTTTTTTTTTTTPTTTSTTASLVSEDPGFVGVLMPSAAIDLAPTYEGKLDKLHVKIGQWVVQGSAVATFDPSAAREELEIARAEVRVAKGEAGQAAALARHAGRRLAVEKQLFEQGISPASAIDDAAADRARAGAAGAGAAGRIAAAKARVEQLERQLEETDLAAPFSGQVALVYREAGAVASPAKPVVRLISTEKSFVRFAVPPAAVSTLRPGATVDVVVEWLAQPMEATIRDFAPQIDPPTGMVFVEAELAPSAVPNARPHSPAWVKLKA